MEKLIFEHGYDKGGGGSGHGMEDGLKNVKGEGAGVFQGG